MFHTANVAEQSLVTTGYAILHAVLIIIFACLACIASTIRIWSRRIQRIALTLSDYTTILGLIFALADAGITVYACCLPTTWKFGESGSPVSRTLSFKLQFVSPIVWVLAVTTIRVAVILLYIQIFPSRRFRFICLAVIAFNFLFMFSTIIAECLICRPLAYRWDLAIKGASCGNEQALTLYTAGLNVLQDVIIVFLPLPELWVLQMAPHKKLGVTCIFSVGIAICAVTSYRVYVTSTITDPVRANRADCDLGVLTSLEALLGIIIACLPMARPVNELCRRLAEPTVSEPWVKKLGLVLSVSDEEYDQQKDLAEKSVGQEAQDQAQYGGSYAGSDDEEKSTSGLYV